jgi:hypothetical protein
MPGAGFLFLGLFKRICGQTEWNSFLLTLLNPNSAVDRLSTETPTAPQYPMGFSKTLRNKRLASHLRFFRLNLKTADESQRRGFIPAWGKRSVAPGQVSLFFIRAEGPNYEKG